MAKGRIFIDVERCKGCEICRAACPQDVIDFAESLNNKGYRPAIFTEPHDNCTGCALCAVVCPDGCITVFKDVPPKREKPISQKEANRYAEAVA